MNRYVEYLLADIRAATEEAPEQAQEWDEDMFLLSLEEEEQTARREQLGRHLGLDPAWFPPVSRLNDDQVRRLLNALEECLQAFGFIPHFPTELPRNRRYQVIVDHLQREVPIMQFNAWQIDFCDYQPDRCPFGEAFCQCRAYDELFSELEDETDLDDEYWADDLPEEDYDPDEDDYRGGIDVSGYDLPHLFSEEDLLGEDERALPGPAWEEEDEEWFPDEFAPPDLDFDEEDED